jgi:hypothetical protein
MKKASFASVITAARLRNQGMTARYAAASRRILSRPVASLANAAAEQRRELEREIEAMLGSLSRDLAAATLEIDESLLSPPAAEAAGEDGACETLGFIKLEEGRDRELFSFLATAARQLQPDLAEGLLQIADGARKRGATAADHLDLLGLSSC